MITKEAVDADFADVATFLRRELRAWGFDSHTSEVRVRALFMSSRRRFTLLREEGIIVAVGAMHPIETKRGSAYQMVVLVSSFAHPDRVRVLDRLSLFICNLLRSEGIHILISRSPDHPHIASLFNRYGVVTDSGIDGLRWGSTETTIANIFRERPEWRPSP